MSTFVNLSFFFYRCISLNSIEMPCFYIPPYLFGSWEPFFILFFSVGGLSSLKKYFSWEYSPFGSIQPFGWIQQLGDTSWRAEWNHNNDLLFTPCQATDSFRVLDIQCKTFPSPPQLSQDNGFPCCQPLVLHHLLSYF